MSTESTQKTEKKEPCCDAQEQKRCCAPEKKAACCGPGKEEAPPTCGCK